MDSPFDVECRPPWLVARFPIRQRMLSWSLNRPGLVMAQQVAWLQVVDADLPLGRDPLAMLENRLAGEGLAGAVGLMTARDIAFHHQAGAALDGVGATVLATLGLTNGVLLDEAGHQIPFRAPAVAGTINMLVAVSCPLSVGAMLEALSVASMARTAALLADGGRIVGTGTDCVVLACPDDPREEAVFAGLHTTVGAMITEAAFRAVQDARRCWEAG